MDSSLLLLLYTMRCAGPVAVIALPSLSLLPPCASWWDGLLRQRVTSILQQLYSIVLSMWVMHRGRVRARRTEILVTPNNVFCDSLGLYFVTLDVPVLLPPPAELMRDGAIAVLMEAMVHLLAEHL